MKLNSEKTSNGRVGMFNFKKFESLTNELKAEDLHFKNLSLQWTV